MGKDAILVSLKLTRKSNLQSFLDTTQNALKYADWIPGVNIGSHYARTCLAVAQVGHGTICAVTGAGLIAKSQVLNGVLNLGRGTALLQLYSWNTTDKMDNWGKAKWAVGLALIAAAYDIFADHSHEVEGWLEPEGFTAHHLWQFSLGFTQIVGGAIRAFRAKCAMVAQIPAGRALFNEGAHHFLAGISTLSRGGLECIPGISNFILWGYE